MGLCFTGIRRDPLYSPGHVENDARILHETARELQRLGHEVELLDEASLNGHAAAPVIFAMCQSPAGIEWLHRAANRGAEVINRPQSILNCYRVHLVRRLAEAGLPFPSSQILPTASHASCIDEALWAGGGLWIKRGDAHALHAEDVVHVQTPAMVDSLLADFRRRGIGQAVAQTHVPGSVLKYYAVRKTGFFRYYADALPPGVQVDESALRRLATQAADALGLDVYGGDVIVTSTGLLVVIDVNDWPSFSRCRDEAASHIARQILQRTLEVNSRLP